MLARTAAHLALLVAFVAPCLAAETALEPADALERLGAIELDSFEKRAVNEATKGLRKLLTELDDALAKGPEGVRGVDLRLVRAQTRLRLFELDELRLHEIVPVRHLGLSSTSSLLLRPCAMADAAIRRAVEELEAFPGKLEVARRVLQTPARTWTENAIEQTRYISAMLESELATVCVDDPELQSQLLDRAASAATAVKAFRQWMETDLLARSTRPPTWTPEQIEVYQFEHEFLEGWGVERLLELARRDEAKTMAAMRALAQRIHPSGDLETVWELMKDETPPWSEVPAMAARYVELADDWLRGPGSHLVEIPERFDYGVAITAPMGRRVLSFGGASYGPTLAGRISGYYVLTPLEPWLSEADRASRLRSYNPYWTHVISYHEWLGHNVQRAIAHEFAETPAQRAFGSIYLSQAWSFYLEKLLEDEGYYEDVLPHVEALKTRMARLQMRMWRVQRILTKLEMARDNMTFDEAVQAYVDKIGMEPTNAHIEVQRDSQSPSPPAREILGEYLILEMRDEYQRRLGDHATLRGFHEALLRYGSLPLPTVRRLMFGDI